MARRMNEPAFARLPGRGGYTDSPREVPRTPDQQGEPEPSHPYRDTRLWEGQHFPYLQAFTFNLPAHTWQPFRVACPVRVRLSVTVNAGLLSLYFLPAAPDTDQFHALFAPQSQPVDFDLPPGVFQLAAFSGLNTRALALETTLVASIVARNLEALADVP